MMFNFDRWGRVASAIVLFLVLLACGSDEITPQQVGTVGDAGDDSGGDQSALSESTVFEVGDIVSVGDAVLVVLGWGVSNGDDFSKPDDGNEFFLIDLILVNQSDESINVSSLLQMELGDDTGQRYGVDFSAAMIADSSPDGEIAAGERVRGQVGFQVPIERSALQFIFDYSVWGSGKVFVDLAP